MESRKQEIRHLCGQFKLGGLWPALDRTIALAENQQMGFMHYTLELLKAEAVHRMDKDEARRLKAAGLPKNANLDHYDASVDNGLSAARIPQLRELNWVDQLYNMVLMGPSGTGKTFIASGLCYDAVKAGYKAYFRTMEDIVNTLKTKDVVKSQQMEYKKLLKANLIVLDDIMLFPLEKNLAVSFFNFINHIYESTSIIITTNKKPTEWAKLLDDEVIATALLDRLLYRCEIINLTGESYRLQNRKSFFGS
jgi:DNA replication protein DnaC